MDLLQKILSLGGNIATGRPQAGLTPEQERSATGQGLTAAGLRTILASQPGAGPGGLAPTFLGALAEGALAGQQAGGAARSGSARQNVLSGVDLSDPEGIAQALPHFLQDPEIFRALVALQDQVAEQQKGDAPDRVDLGDRFVFYDPNDPSKIVETILKSPEANDQTNKLATEYTRAVGTDVEVARALSRVLASAESPSAAGDMSLVFAYMKLLDPTSSVREGEQATARNAGSVPDRVIALYNNAFNGQVFGPELRADFVDRTRRLVQSQRPILNQTMNRFRRRAEASRVTDPSLVIFDPYAPFEEFLTGGQNPTGMRSGGNPATDPTAAGVPPGTINPITGKPIGGGI